MQVKFRYGDDVTNTEPEVINGSFVYDIKAKEFFLDINNERVGIGSKNNIRTDLSAEYAAVEDEAKTPETYLAAQEEGSYIIKTETEIIQSDNNKIEDSIFVQVKKITSNSEIENLFYCDGTLIWSSNYNNSSTEFLRKIISSGLQLGDVNISSPESNQLLLSGSNNGVVKIDGLALPTSDNMAVSKKYSDYYSICLTHHTIPTSFNETTVAHKSEFYPRNPYPGKYVVDFHGTFGTIIAKNADLYTIQGSNVNFNKDYAKTEEAVKMTSITYADLKELKNNNELIPGMQYRITDYECIVANNEEARVVSHPFDIIVTADNESTLNENARACLHEGDTYYSDNNCRANLSAWKLKYSFENDTERFTWADAQNGKGVIYWLKDEWDNECPYDFKQIQFKRYKIIVCVNSSSLENKYFATLSVNNNYITVIDSDDYIWVYTFSTELNDSIVDASTYNWIFMTGHSEEYIHCYSNVIKKFVKDDILNELNNIVFISQQPYCSNILNNNCYNNTFGNECSNNIFGDNCYNNILANYCSQNTFNNNCCDNILGQYCDNNIFKNGCSNNIFDFNCYSNTFNNNCSNIIFGQNCRYNKLGNYVQDIRISSFCHFCVFDDNVQTVILATDIANNNNKIQNYHFLNNQGNRIIITPTLNLPYVKYVGINSAGQIVQWNPADQI